MDAKSQLITFHGTVQGVGFRYTVHRIATRYELTGYVRNLDDGSVEMFAQGHPDDIDNCVDDIRESFNMYIRKIDRQDMDVDENCTEFGIRM